MAFIQKKPGYSNFNSDPSENNSTNINNEQFNSSNNKTNNQSSSLNLDENSMNNSNGNFVTNYLSQIKPSYNSQKTLLTFIYCITFWNFGICVAIFGPTLLDLACQTSSSLSAMSLLYFMQNFTSLIGCFLSGMILKNKWLSITNFLLISTLLMPLSVSLMPLARHVLFLGAVMAFLGFNMGCIDNIANLAILKLHSDNVSPYIQTMHFFYGVGAFLTPIIVKSFLNMDITFTSSSLNCFSIEDVVRDKPALPISIDSHQLLNHTLATHFTDHKTEFTSRTKYAFWILAAIQLPAPIVLILAKFSKKINDTDTQLSAENDQTQDSQNMVEDNLTEKIDSSFSFSYFKSLFSNTNVLQLTLLISLLVFLFEGLQAAHGGFIFSYAVEKYDIKQSKLSSMFKNDTKSKLAVTRHHHQQDAYITACFWAFFSIGRLISIFIATKFSASFMILIDIIGCIISAVIMLTSSFLNMISLLYIATCLLGLFLSNTTPTSYSLAEIYIGMTPTLTSFVIICAASGEMILPLIVSNFFETTGPNSLITIEIILALATALTFARFIYYGKTHGKCFDSRDSFIWAKKFNSPRPFSQSEESQLVGKSSVKYYSKMKEENDDY